MSSLSVIRDAVRSTLDINLADTHVYDFIPDNPTYPAVCVAPSLANFDAAFGRGLDVWELALLVLVARGSDRSGQDKLDQYITGAGALSIRQVIFNNRTLGLADTDAHVAALDDYGVATGLDAYQARLRLIVQTNGTS